MAFIFIVFLTIINFMNTTLFGLHTEGKRCSKYKQFESKWQIIEPSEEFRKSCSQAMLILNAISISTSILVTYFLTKKSINKIQVHKKKKSLSKK